MRLCTNTLACGHMRVNAHCTFRGIFHLLSITYYFNISPNPLFPLPSFLSVSLFLLIHSTFSLCLSEYLHLSDLIRFIFFLTHISISSSVLLLPLSPLSLSPLLCFLSFDLSACCVCVSVSVVVCFSQRVVR